jgi:hypothetical protein
LYKKKTFTLLFIKDKANLNNFLIAANDFFLRNLISIVVCPDENSEKEKVINNFFIINYVFKKLSRSLLISIVDNDAGRGSKFGYAFQFKNKDFGYYLVFSIHYSKCRNILKTMYRIQVRGAQGIWLVVCPRWSVDIHNKFLQNFLSHLTIILLVKLEENLLIYLRS